MAIYKIIKHEETVTKYLILKNYLPVFT